MGGVPATALPAVPMATPVHPIVTAIERDRIAYLAFAASFNKSDGRKAAQEDEVTQTDEDAHEATSLATQSVLPPTLGNRLDVGLSSFRPYP
jgi:hypothetical protein